MKQIFLFASISLLTLFLFLNFTSQKDEEKALSEMGWQLVFKNDENGKAVYGDKQLLIDAVRKGYPVRLGFGGRRAADTTKSVEHVADATFLTIANNEEVFGQIQSIIGQKPKLNSDSIRISFREHLSWTMIAGTNGYSDRMTTNHRNDSIVGHRSRYTHFTWYVNYNSAAPNTQAASPLWQR